MRIAEFSDTFLPIVDGVGRVAYQYANGLGRRGHECYAICPQADTGYRGALPFEIIDYISIPLANSPQYKAGMPVLDSHYYRRVGMIPFDIMHAHSPGIAGVEAMRLARKLNLPLVGTFHSKYHDDLYRFTGSESLATIGTHYVAEFYRACDEVWTVSHNAAQTLIEYGYEGPVEIMPNGTQMREIDPADVALAQKKYGIGADPVLLYVGQIDWKKNLARTIEAAGMLHESGAKFQLILVGQGNDADAVREKLTSCGIGHCSIMTGHISDFRILNGLYACADLFVFPSLYDTAGLVIREAAIMHTPSVAVYGSAPAECIRDGENGFLCMDTSESLFCVLRFALADREALRRVGDCAAKTIPIPWDTVLDMVEERYLRLIARVKRSGRKKRMFLKKNRIEENT